MPKTYETPHTMAYIIRKGYEIKIPLDHTHVTKDYFDSLEHSQKVDRVQAIAILLLGIDVDANEEMDFEEL